MSQDSTELNANRHEAYWQLVNRIDELCCQVLSSEENGLKGSNEALLYMGDVVGALDRVKTKWIQDQLRFSLEEPDQSIG